MKLGQIIIDYRLANNISQGAFAIKSGLSKGYISMIENGINPRDNSPIEPTLPSLRKIANGLNLEIDMLLKMLDDTTIVNLKDESVLSRTEEILLRYFDKINEPGQRKVIDYAKDLSSNPLYQANNEIKLELLAAHVKDNATEEGKQSDIDKVKEAYMKFKSEGKNE